MAFSDLYFVHLVYPEILFQTNALPLVRACSSSLYVYRKSTSCKLAPAGKSLALYPLFQITNPEERTVLALLLTWLASRRYKAKRATLQCRPFCFII